MAGQNRRELVNDAPTIKLTDLRIRQMAAVGETEIERDIVQVHLIASHQTSCCGSAIKPSTDCPHELSAAKTRLTR